MLSFFHDQKMFSFFFSPFSCQHILLLIIAPFDMFSFFCQFLAGSSNDQFVVGGANRYSAFPVFRFVY